MIKTEVDIHQAIIDKALKGNSRAQKKLYDLYAKAMLNICFRMMNNVQEAEDVLQEVFCEVFKQLVNFRGESSFGSWIKRITINKCINELKRRKIELELNEGVVPPVLMDEDDDSDELQLTVDKIKSAMSLLPDGYRVVFSLYLIEGYDHQEIAEIMGVSVSTSKSQLLRAKKKIIEIIGAGEMHYKSN